MLGKYAFRLRQGPATIARASFNDLPFFKDVSTAWRTTADNADHLLVPGENTMTLDLWDGPPSPDSPTIKGPVELTVLRCEGEEVIELISWPTFAIQAGQDPMALEMPFTWTVKFTLPDDHLKPAYAANPPEEIPREGTPELHAAVAAMHDALARQDARAFVSSFRIKLEDFGRFYGNPREASEGMLIGAYEARFSKKYDVAPLEPELLVFESRADKRAAYVTRKDGKPVLSARREEGEDIQSFDLDPIFIRRDQTWTLLR